MWRRVLGYFSHNSFYMCKLSLSTFSFIKHHRCIWMLCVWSLESAFGCCQNSHCNHAKTSFDFLYILDDKLASWPCDVVHLKWCHRDCHLHHSFQIFALVFRDLDLCNLFKHDDTLHAHFLGWSILEVAVIPNVAAIVTVNIVWDWVSPLANTVCHLSNLVWKY